MQRYRQISTRARVMEKKISIYKLRIIEYLDSKGISKREFYMKTGLGNGLLDKDSSLTLISVEKIISTFEDINAFWLLTGKGAMIAENNGGSVNIQGSVASNNNINIGGSTNKQLISDGSDKIDLVSVLQQQLSAKDDHIRHLSEMLSKAQDTIYALSSSR